MGGAHVNSDMAVHSYKKSLLWRLFYITLTFSNTFGRFYSGLSCDILQTEPRQIHESFILTKKFHVGKVMIEAS